VAPPDGPTTEIRSKARHLMISSDGVSARVARGSIDPIATIFRGSNCGSSQPPTAGSVERAQKSFFIQSHAWRNALQRIPIHEK
jgi:hypothetical protein